jgi:hypothetical protein
MEPEGSLPHSQVPATCLSPEPAQSSQYPHIPISEHPSKYYPSICAWVSPVVSFPQISPGSRESWELYNVVCVMIRVVPGRSHRLHYTGAIFLCVLLHWAHISVGSHMCPWWWHPGMPKHVGEYWVPIRRMINVFVGVSFISRKCTVQNEKPNPYYLETQSVPRSKHLFPQL